LNVSYQSKSCFSYTFIAFIITHISFIFLLYSFTIYVGNNQPATADDYSGATGLARAGSSHNVIPPPGDNQIRTRSSVNSIRHNLGQNTAAARLVISPSNLRAHQYGMDPSLSESNAKKTRARPFGQGKSPMVIDDLVGGEDEDLFMK
jgi:hypothetical protein